MQQEEEEKGANRRGDGTSGMDGYGFYCLPEVPKNKLKKDEED